MIGSIPPDLRPRRSTIMNGGIVRSRRETLGKSTAKYYAPHTRHLSTSHNHRNFARMLSVRDAEIPRVAIEGDQLRRFSLVQVGIILIFIIC